jgi:hypothetical protein
MSKISLAAAADFKGKRPVLSIRREVVLPNDEKVMEDFGAIFAMPVTVKDEEGKEVVYNVQGFLGRGKTIPVYGTFDENPGKSEKGNDLPALKLFTLDKNGDQFDYAAAWKRGSDEKSFFSGSTTYSEFKKENFVFNPVAEKATEA